MRRTNKSRKRKRESPKISRKRRDRGIGQNDPAEKCAVGSTGGWAATPEQTGTAFRREGRKSEEIRQETHWKIKEAERSQITRTSVRSLQKRERGDTARPGQDRGKWWRGRDGRRRLGQGVAVDLRCSGGWEDGGRGYQARCLECWAVQSLPAGRKSLVRRGLSVSEPGGRAGRCCWLAYF